MTTIAQVAHDRYEARCHELDMLSRDYEAIGDGDKAREHRVAAAIVWEPGGPRS